MPTAIRQNTHISPIVGVQRTSRQAEGRQAGDVTVDHGDVSAAAAQRVGEFLGHGDSSVAFVPAMHIDVDRRAAVSGQGERVPAYVADELVGSGGGQHVRADSRVKAGVRDPFLGDHLGSGSSSPQGIRRADGRSPHHAANPSQRRRKSRWCGGGGPGPAHRPSRPARTTAAPGPAVRQTRSPGPGDRVDRRAQRPSAAAGLPACGLSGALPERPFRHGTRSCPHHPRLRLGDELVQGRRARFREPDAEFAEPLARGLRHRSARRARLWGRVPG
ncbi:hypothetical protein DWB77_07463 [Streptomyces hundungensis]|uniref:Uncharacterized protein n=1 Tax=Streptomyces hundungensis TaxID=1077946 RepID=A0A387HMU3_9ACTN|nr:hypothetical protein DWB77_07463 [Streptomyces hundungensis]